MTRAARASVAILGGGFSGAAVAWHLLRLRPDLERVVIVEPRAEIGRGLAYSAPDPNHRINVPASRMSLDPAQPEMFNDWLLVNDRLAGDPAATLGDGRNFPSRAEFGAYVNAQVQTLGGRVEHMAAKAEHVVRTGDGFSIACSDGRGVEAPVVVVAVCHPPPSAPAGIGKVLDGHPRFVPNPWGAGALDAIRPDDRVLIVGSGLTMADIVATLESRGHQGGILAVSRRGLRSRGHPVGPAHEPYGDFATEPARSVRKLIRRVRATVAAAAAEGKSWHFVFDQLKAQGTAIWRALPLDERRRLLRHIRPFWDVHRFRIAPQIEAVLERRTAEGSFALKSASLRGFRREGERIDVELRDRRSGASTTEAFDAVVLATGPAHGRVFADNALLGALEAEGLARPDPLRLGIEVDLAGRAIGRDGVASGDIFIAGPLARGTFGELMGLPDVANHAVRVAQGVAERLDAAAGLTQREQRVAAG